MTKPAEFRNIELYLTEEIGNAFSLLFLGVHQLEKSPYSTSFSPFWELFHQLDRCLLVNHYCLLLIERKMIATSGGNKHRIVSDASASYELGLNVVNEQTLFKELRWLRPAHFESPPDKPLSEIEHELAGQRGRVLSALKLAYLSVRPATQTKNPPATRHNPNVYHYIWFITQQMKACGEQLQAGIRCLDEQWEIENGRKDTAGT